MPVARKKLVPASDWSGLMSVDWLISLNLWFSWLFDSCFFFFFFLEILGTNQIFGFMRQSPCLGLLCGSCPTCVGFVSSFHLSQPLRCYWTCLVYLVWLGILLVSNEAVWKGFPLGSWVFLCRKGVHVFPYRCLPATLRRRAWVPGTRRLPAQGHLL